MAKTTIKTTICLWCGKSHRSKRPGKCERLSRIMSEVCRKEDTWKVMRVLEVHGIDGLIDVAKELGIDTL
jgi:hypothetical protein